MTNSERHADLNTRYGDFGGCLGSRLRLRPQKAQNAFNGAWGRIDADCRRRTIPKLACLKTIPVMMRPSLGAAAEISRRPRRANREAG